MLCTDSRQLLIYFALKYNGDYEKIYLALALKEDPPIEEVLEVTKKVKSRTLTILDYDYPLKLKQLYRPPFVLFYYGDITLLDKQILGVVGSREYNECGKKWCESVISEVIKGRVVVSGLARGIDTIAHTCAIQNHARTIAVLGCGIDFCYPSENQELYDEIKKNHLIISEYPGSLPPQKFYFPMRNRIVVGLSDGIYIPQINNYMSGTMISLNLALNLGKEVFVSPHPVDSGTINNRLIDEGATFTKDGQIILTELHWR